MRKTGKNLSDLSASNRSQIMHYLAKHPGCSRSELGAITGLTLASITKIIHSLIECGVIYEIGFAEGKKGRRSVGLSIRYEKYKILSIKLSWRRLDIHVFDFLGNTYGELISIPFENITIDNISDVIKAAKNGISLFCMHFPEIMAVGMAVPGPYYRDSGNLLLPPYNTDFEKRHYYPLKDELSKCTHLPIFIEHDAHAGALAYWLFESPFKTESIIMNILAEDGIGIGLIDNGQIFKGGNNTSCEMGHILIDYKGRFCPRCGRHGCMDAFCSTQALEEIAKEQLSNHPNSLLNNYETFSYHSIIQAANQQDKFASNLIFQCGKYFGHGILSLLHVFKPDIIIINGKMTLAGDLLMNGINDIFSKEKSLYSTIPEIKFLSPNMDLTLMGGAAFAINRILNSPSQYFTQ